MMMVFFFALGDRDYASMCYFADCVFELNRGVIDAELVKQPLFHVPKDPLAG